MKNKKKIIFSVIILFVFLSFLHFSFAAPYTTQEKIPGAAQQQTEFIPYLKDILNFGLAVIGILALFMLVIGAYQYLMAAGNIGKVDSAKETIGSALLGLILGLCAWIILYKINPDLVNFRAIHKIVGISAAPGMAILIPKSIAGKVIATEDAIRKEYDPIIEKYARQEGVEADAIRAIIAHESQWNQQAISPTNDYGLMQINEKSHPSFFANGDWKDPEYNISYGTKYFAERYKWAKTQTSDPAAQHLLAFAAYNQPANPNMNYAAQVNWQFERFVKQSTLAKQKEVKFQ
jgi:hypothetical protein